MIQLLSNIPSYILTLLSIWLLLLVVAIILYSKNSKYWKYSLFFAAFCIASAFALFSQYLYMWDEQFHALVGKNCMTTPFHPKVLRNNPIDFNSTEWLLTTTWLHKQPLFTWLIALSMKLFGVSTFAVRLPSVLFHAIMTLVVYRIGSIIFSKKAGFISALLFMHSAYLLGLVSGRIGTDHNDYIFMSFIGLSFWAYFEWRESSLKKWLIWIGIFVGCAVLTKWLVGLLVFFGWGMVFILELIRFKDRSQFKPLLKSFFISLLVFLPWQIYTHLRFPEIAKQEMEYNSLHLWQSVEGHAGDWFYHFDLISDLYFYKADFLVVFLISVSLLFLRKVNWRKSLFLLSSCFVVYLFFSFAQTKMPSFTVPIYPIVLLIIGFGVVELTGFIKQKTIQAVILSLSTLILINILLKPSLTLKKYGFEDGTDAKKAQNMIIKQADFIRENATNQMNRVVFGCELRGVAFASWMFYTNDIAYPFYPDEKTVNSLINKGYEIVLIDWNNSIPAHLKTDKRLKVLIYPDK